MLNIELTVGIQKSIINVLLLDVARAYMTRAMPTIEIALC